MLSAVNTIYVVPQFMLLKRARRNATVALPIESDTSVNAPFVTRDLLH
jgi:hypothetical protein